MIKDIMNFPASRYPSYSFPESIDDLMPAARKALERTTGRGALGKVKPKEKVIIITPEIPRVQDSNVLDAVIKAFKESFLNKPFLIGAITYSFLDFCFGFTLMILPLYAKFIINMEKGMEGFAMAGVALGILCGVPLWWKIYGKKGPKLFRVSL